VRAVIEGWPGYEVGEDGGVWSCRTSRGTLGTVWHPLSGRPDKDGYLSVTLQGGGRRKTVKVTHLVLSAFVGPRPPGAEALHSLGTLPGDCRLSVLRWGTHLENIGDKVLGATQARRDSHGMARLTEADVVNIRSAYVPGAKNGKPPSNAGSLAAQYGITAAHVGQVVRGNFWKP
jgi:hypothetical protein